ncbi:hypothetical protein ABZ926_06825 [Streptomyces litmocidini]|uniref:hypothetical protein n=1 Tax=Streptomyces litmocidini TaxID=67318 RepID=UPI0033E59012
MSIHARLSGSVRLPGGRELITGDVYESRGAGTRRALLFHGADLEVHELEDLFAGERAPAAVFPMPWPGWDRGGASVSPDGTLAVFSGQRAVRAVGADGTALWEYRHPCWGPVLGHAHTGDEQQVCYGSEHGSVRVSDDGRFVWAHVLAPGEEQPEECWSVLDARDGRELARLPLDDSAAAGSRHLSHPDGVHMGLCIGMGQDGILLYWARWDGERPTVWDLNESLDRILVDVHPAHEGFLTVEHYGHDLSLHALDGEALAEQSEPTWDHAAGFVDADTVIATTGVVYDKGPRHWLLDARTLEIRGSVTYSHGPVPGLVRPLGDGSWLTYDEKSETLNRWTVR